MRPVGRWLLASMTLSGATCSAPCGLVQRGAAPLHAPPSPPGSSGGQGWPVSSLRCTPDDRGRLAPLPSGKGRGGWDSGNFGGSGVEPRVCADFDVELVEMDGEEDHVHLLVNYPPKLAVSTLVNSLKGVSSRLLRRDRPDIAKRYYYKGVLWSPSYFAGSCGGAPISIIRQYIEQQQTPR